MPAVIVNELKYDSKTDFYSISLYEFLKHFQVTREGYYIYGNLEFCRIDKKVGKEVSEAITLQVKGYDGSFFHPNDEILRKYSITPGSWICLVLESYSKTYGDTVNKYPIYPDYFEIIHVPEALREEVENRFKGAEEILKLIKLEGVVNELEEAYEHLQKVYAKFKTDSFEDSKTSARKTLSVIRNLVRSWRKIDDSEHLAEWINGFVNALYNLSSSGGAHRGVANKEETELILYSVFYLFKYTNKIIKENRFEKKERK